MVENMLTFAFHTNRNKMLNADWLVHVLSLYVKITFVPGGYKQKMLEFLNWEYEKQLQFAKKICYRMQKSGKKLEQTNEQTIFIRILIQEAQNKLANVFC